MRRFQSGLIIHGHALLAGLLISWRKWDRKWIAWVAGRKTQFWNLTLLQSHCLQSHAVGPFNQASPTLHRPVHQGFSGRCLSMPESAKIWDSQNMCWHRVKKKILLTNKASCLYWDKPLAYLIHHIHSGWQQLPTASFPDAVKWTGTYIIQVDSWLLSSSPQIINPYLVLRDCGGSVVTDAVLVLTEDLSVQPDPKHVQAWWQ